MLAVLVWTVLFFGLASAHIAPFAPGMYCKNGPKDDTDYNSYDVVLPLYQMSFSDWWMHGYDGCNRYPPPDGEFLELPAGGEFTVEMGSNRAKTTLSYNGRDTSDWPDGNTYPDNYDMGPGGCIGSPNLHTQNEAMAAGTAFAISYNSNINDVTPDNLVVFSVLERSPWKRVAKYQVPAAMPACPDGGCICAWGWIPNGCGIPNMYMTPFKCTVTGATSTTPVGTPQPPVWCEDDQSKCVQGPKQMLYWHQLEGNNIDSDDSNYKLFDFSGAHRSPGYNSKTGFQGGAQNDIFTGAPSNGGDSSSQTGSSNSDSGSSNDAGNAYAAAPQGQDTSSQSQDQDSNNAPAPAPSSSSSAPAPSGNSTTDVESSSRRCGSSRKRRALASHKRTARSRW